MRIYIYIHAKALPRAPGSKLLTRFFTSVSVSLFAICLATPAFKTATGHINLKKPFVPSEKQF